MVTVLGLWEDVWMDAARTERRLWKQTIQSFEVDVWAMCPSQGGPFTSPHQHDTLEEMLAAYPGRKTFIIPPGRVDASQGLRDYDHPSDAIYVFGSTPESMASYVTGDDDVVSIYSPQVVDLFAPVALGIVLYDREAKARR